MIKVPEMIKHGIWYWQFALRNFANIRHNFSR